VQRFSAYGLVTDPADRILLTRISDGYPGAGTWHLPGGGTDFGEQPKIALDRELREETGQAGRVGALMAIAYAHNPAAYGPEKRPIDWHTVRAIFRVHVTGPTEPRVHDHGGSTDRAAWFTLAELRELPLNKLARGIIAKYVL
jgi:ADP-ribose pyrophosphatase YjhB (NUDIX family)